MSDGIENVLPLRCLSVDVEDYYHIEAAYGRVDRRDWRKYPSRVERNTDLLLELFARHDRKATFFILGDVARHHTTLARRIASAGHEIASHGHNHDRLHRLTPQSFRADLSACRKLLEDQTGQRVCGYRAPTFSVTTGTRWAIDVLIELGFEYDSSVFPVTHPAYGVPGAPLEPFHVTGTSDGKALLEVPPLVWRTMGRRVAVAGGGYFRLLPLWFMKQGLRQAARENRPAVLYFHPWEFDPDMPRLPLSATGRLRTYTGLRTAAAKLESIITQPANWSTIAAALPLLKRHAETSEPFVLSRAA